MPSARACGRRVDGGRSAVHLDRALVEPMHAAEALDQRRLARTVVAQQRKHLAAAHVQVDPSSASTAPNRLVAPRTASGDGSRDAVMPAPPRRPGTAPRDARGRRRPRPRATMTTPITISWRNASTFKQVHPVADDADHQRPDQSVDRRCHGRRGSWRRRSRRRRSSRAPRARRTSASRRSAGPR